eukprot:13916524-Alexandrium_andersonii.AAC.1
MVEARKKVDMVEADWVREAKKLDALKEKLAELTNEVAESEAMLQRLTEQRRLIAAEHAALQ